MKRKRSRRPNHREGEDESAKKANSAPDLCDDAVLSIFSRLPTRDAFRCAALSKRHRQLIAGAEFWLHHHGHRRLNPPPPPRPNIAYMITVVEPKPASDRPPSPLLDLALPRCAFLDFHHHQPSDGGLRYSLVDRVHLRHKYAGTCNGVILLAPARFSGGGATVILFNPASAGSEVAVRVELPRLPAHGRYRVAGFGYGAASRAHRVIVTREERVVHPNEKRAKCSAAYRAKELLSYTFGLAGGEPDHRRLRSVLPELDAKKVSGKPVFLDGKVYLLADYSRVLAFDVDDETVTTIKLPGEGPAPGKNRHARSKLMEVSGRLCVATGGGGGATDDGDMLALWLLAADQQWVRLCELRRCGGGAVSSKVVGAWDVGGVVLVYLVHRQSKVGHLHMYDTKEDEEFVKRVAFPRPVAGQGGGSGRVFCWGYRPTLVSPGSIVGGAPPRRVGKLAAALDPLVERDVEAGRERTLEAVCIMNLLLYIMSKLPDNTLDVINEIKRRTLPFSLR